MRTLMYVHSQNCGDGTVNVTFFSTIAAMRERIAFYHELPDDVVDLVTLDTWLLDNPADRGSLSWIDFELDADGKLTNTITLNIEI